MASAPDLPEPPPRPLRVVIVEDHHEMLPHVHRAIKKRLLPFSGVSIVHVDAHPDLMMPDAMPAATVFQPQELYAALDESDGGIAEFLLPLVYAGHLSHMLWLRPWWADQIADGVSSVWVGEDSASGLLRTSSEHPYYVDDRLWVPHEQLEQPKELRLLTSTVPLVTSVRMGPGSDDDECEFAATAAFVLDICLDYFHTCNPFLKEVEVTSGAEVAAAARELFCRPLYKGRDTLLPHAEQVRAEAAFTPLADRYFAELWPRKPREEYEALTAELRGFFAPDEGGPLLERCRALFAPLGDEALAQIREMGRLADLPAHASSREEVAAMVAELKAHVMDAFPRPAMVTIARSAEDGYTPDAEFVLDEVLEALRRAYGELGVEWACLSPSGSDDSGGDGDGAGGGDGAGDDDRVGRWRRM